MNLFLELRRHGKLADKRHPMYDKNKFGRVFMYAMAVFWAGYLVFFAFAFEGESREPYQLINGVIIIFLALDFLMRFPFQKTPTQEVKPYLLLPVRRKRLIDCLLLRSGLNGFNFVWLFFFVPLAILSVARFYGVAGVLTYSVGIWLLMVMGGSHCPWPYTAPSAAPCSSPTTARCSTGRSPWAKASSRGACSASSSCWRPSPSCGSSTGASWQALSTAS